MGGKLETKLFSPINCVFERMLILTFSIYLRLLSHHHPGKYYFE